MEEKELDLLKVFQIIWKRKIFIGIIVFITTSITIGITLILPLWYKASASILPPTQGGDVFSMLGGIQNMSFGQMYGGNSDQFRVLSILKSRNLKERVVKKFNLQERYKSKFMIDAINTLNDNMDIGIGEEMQIYIHVWDKDKEMVADIAQYIVYCLDSINIAISSKKASDTRRFLDERVNVILDSLYVLETDLQKFMDEEDVLSLEDQVRVGVENAAALKYEMIMADIELAVARENYPKENPQIALLGSKLKSIKNKYGETFGKEDGDLFPDFSKIPELGIKMKELERKSQYYTTILEFIGPQLEKAKIDEKKNIPTIEVLEWPVRPEKKDKPHRATIVILVFLISSVLTTTYTLTRERLWMRK